MGWTPERVELLKNLWQDGLSASQIAKQLGGLTRCAVLGKVHRLGLSGRQSPTRPGSRSYAAKPRAPRADATVRVAPSAPRLLIAGNGAVFEQPEARMPREIVRFVDEARGLVTSLTLGAHQCKWPIGDPALDGFTHCGRRAGDGPYCDEHALVAYQPAAAKKRTGLELARSLRRYL